MKGVSGRDERVMHPKAVFANADQASFPEIGEMAGDRGLGSTDDRNEIADAKLAAQEEMEDAQASAVREGPKDQIGSNGAI